jgi:hypothetical protein
MSTWAGTTDMVVVRRPPARAGRLAGIRTYREEPAPNSVHLVDEATGQVVCGAVYPSMLTRLDPPWSEWAGVYRCGRCHEMHPTN